MSEQKPVVIDTGIAWKQGQTTSEALVTIAKMMNQFKGEAPAHLQQNGWEELVAWIEVDPKGRYQTLMNLVATFCTNCPEVMVHLLKVVSVARKEACQMDQKVEMKH